MTPAQEQNLTALKAAQNVTYTYFAGGVRRNKWVQPRDKANRSGFNKTALESLVTLGLVARQEVIAYRDASACKPGECYWAVRYEMKA